MKLNYFIIPLVTVLVAVLGSRFTVQSLSGWYKSLNLPSIAPPGGFIGAVWTILFILATISALLVWNKFPHDTRFYWIIAIFILNAVLNFGWSWLFFGQHQIFAAIFEAGALGLSVLALVVLIWPESVLAASLLIPYAVWVFFATYLTYSIWSLNK